MDRVVLTIKNFSTYQHYKNRNPPWIKLHVKVLNDMNFMALAPASRCLLMLLWIIAAENHGTIDSTIEEIGFRLRDKKFSIDSLRPLIHGGFLLMQADASTALAAAPKTLSETETETETEGEREGAKVALAKPRGKRPISEEDKPTDKHFAFGQQLGVNIGPEWGKFKNYCLAHDKRYANFEAAFRNWIAKAAEMKGGGHVLRNV